jgi:hypothetical protein
MLIGAKKLIDLAFKLLSTVSALLPALFVYIITNYEKMAGENTKEISFIKNNASISFILYVISSLLIILALNHIFLFITSKLDGESINNIVSVEPVNDNFLPTYLGYFFVSVSISSVWVFSYFILMVLAFNLFSKVYFFNPSLLISGFKFYHLVSQGGVKTLLITKEDIRSNEDISDSNYKRINDFTFIRR